MFEHEKICLKNVAAGKLQTTVLTPSQTGSRSSTNHKNKDRLAHPVLQRLGHLTQLAPEVHIHSEVQVPLQGKTGVRQPQVGTEEL